jgi:hypothetical protein
MPFVVRNKENGLFAKIRKKGWPRGTEWVADMNEATTYRNEGAALISCGVRHKNPNKAIFRQESNEFSAAMTKQYGPLYGVTRFVRSTGEETQVKPAWPEEVQKKQETLYNRYNREPFDHMVLPAHLEIVPVSFIQVGVTPFSKE